MDILTPHAVVEIENRRFDSWRGEDLISAGIDLTGDKSGEGVIEVYDPKFLIVDGFLGNVVRSHTARFWFGWGANLGNPLFFGQLARVERGDFTTTFRFHDASAKMKRQKKARYHKKKTDLQILKGLAEENGLKFVAVTRNSESPPFNSIVQSGKSDWQFALKIAAKAGLRLYVQGDTLFGVETATSELQPPVATLEYGKDFTLLRGFNLTYKFPTDSRSRRGKTEVRGRGRGDKQLKGVTQLAESSTSDLIVREDLPIHSVTLAEQRAKSKINRKREYSFEHRLRTLHNFRQTLNLRNTITLAGVGKFFSGNYVVTEINHQFRAGSLITEMTVGGDLK